MFKMATQENQHLIKCNVVYVNLVNKKLLHDYRGFVNMKHLGKYMFTVLK